MEIHTAGDPTDTEFYRSHNLLIPSEGESLVEELRTFSIEEIGSGRWMEQHAILEKLNMQAHYSAESRSDEFVMEAVLLFNKVEVIIHELLAIEKWKSFVYPRVKNFLDQRSSTLRGYFLLYHEATVINLLEILFYHESCCEAAGEALSELVDYGCRKMAWLNDLQAEEREIIQAIGTPKSVKVLETSSESELHRHFVELEFSIALSAITVLRFITERAPILHLGVIARILDTRDVLMSLVPLIENPPWTFRSRDGKWYKWQQHKWEDTKPQDLLKITKTEGQVSMAKFQKAGLRSQLCVFTLAGLVACGILIPTGSMHTIVELMKAPYAHLFVDTAHVFDCCHHFNFFRQISKLWLAIFNLLCRKEFRERYQMTSSRKNNLLRIRRYLNDVMLDQLPVLADVQRYMDELQIINTSDVAFAGSGLIMEQVLTMSTSLSRGKNWESIAQTQIEEYFSVPEEKDECLKKMASLYYADVDDTADITKLNETDSSSFTTKTIAEKPKDLVSDDCISRVCSMCGEAAKSRCSRCKGVAYCSRDCQVSGWKSHKALCEELSRKREARAN